MRKLFILIDTLVLAIGLSACGSGSSTSQDAPETPDPPEVVLGERFFLETRFAEFFATRSGGHLNTPLSAGDPVMDVTQTTGAPLPGPFAGASMNCRACHLVDEQEDIRTYADFARRSPIPARDDGRTTTPRNSPPLVNSSLSRPGGFFLHFDGEFASLEDLARGTYTGRNFGWLPTEADQAVAHIAAVIRQDDGSGSLAADFGGLPYAVVLAGTAPEIPDIYRLPEDLRFDINGASDTQILDAVDRLVAAYVSSLVFAQDAAGAFSGSPYDRFLRKNGLPRQPDEGESDLDYSRRLRARIDGLSHPEFVTLRDGFFELHDQEFQFGPRELEGLKLFLREPDSGTSTHVGSCVSCHAAPVFTDFKFHNTGATQDEYDAIHGDGTFAALEIPDLATRNANPDEFLAPSAAHPQAKGAFLAIPSAATPGHTDLGLWNVFANPSIPAPQASLIELLCAGAPPVSCTPEQLLPATIAIFKTAGLRDLGQSAPYLHTGRQDTLEDVITFYIESSDLTRQGELRNAAPELAGIALTDDDIAPLAAFLRALNEDYQ